MLEAVQVRARLANENALRLKAQARHAAKKERLSHALCDDMRGLDQVPTPTSDAMNKSSFEKRLLEPYEDAALCEFVTRRARSERCTSRVLAISRNPEARPGHKLYDRFMEAWRQNPNFSLKIGFHGTSSAATSVGALLTRARARVRWS